MISDTEGTGIIPVMKEAKGLHRQRQGPAAEHAHVRKRQCRRAAHVVLGYQHDRGGPQSLTRIVFRNDDPKHAQGLGAPRRFEANEPTGASIGMLRILGESPPGAKELGGQCARLTDD